MPIMLLVLAGIVTLLAFPKNSEASMDENSPLDQTNKAFDQLFKDAAKKYGLDWKFLKRISWIESRVGTYPSVARGIRVPTDIKGSVSQDGKSWGLMQVTLATGGDYDKSVTPIKLNDPAYSIDLAAKHFAFLKKRYFSNERDLAMAYNHGQGNQLRFIEKEKARTLGLNEFVAGRDYYSKYLLAKREIP